MSRWADGEEASFVFLEESFPGTTQVLHCLGALCKTLPIDNGSTPEHTRPNLGQEVVCFSVLTCCS